MGLKVHLPSVPTVAGRVLPPQATETVAPGWAVPVSTMPPAASVALTTLSPATLPVKPPKFGEM